MIAGRLLPAVLMTALCAVIAVNHVHSQQAQTEQRQPHDAGHAAVAIPTGDRATSVLLLEASGPAEVRVGQDYDYQIQVTNLTQNVTLEDIKIHQEAGDGFAVESSEPDAEESDNGQPQWTIDRLGPGESKTIRITASGDEEGDAAICLRASYNVCLMTATRFVKPEISVAKEAPEVVDICEPIEFRYVVENTGSAPVRQVVLRDELPEGLRTADGQEVVEAEIGDLAAGQSRQVSARIHATETGEFSSRAVARAEDDLRARSRETTTKIVAAQLDVQIEGPDVRYVNDPTTYRITVTNDGDAPAVGTVLHVHIDENARLARTSKSDPGEVAPQQPDERTLAWELGTLEPDQSSVVSVTITGRTEAELTHTAIATARCAADEARQEDLGARAETTTTTQILTLPALLLAMVDQEDPVEVGGIEIYTITVINQGSGEDTNVQVIVELPEQFEYVDSSGPTEAETDGQTVTFEPLERLGPGVRVAWNLRVKANEPGDVRTRVELTSDYLSSPAASEEPTRIIDSQGQPADEDGDRDRDDEQDSDNDDQDDDDEESNEDDSL